MLEYRGYFITLNPKGVRSRAFDWDFRHLDWFGADDPRCGCCGNVDEATELIDWIEDGDRSQIARSPQVCDTA